MTAKPFKFIRKWREGGELHCEYEARFWEGPTEAGEVGRYVTKRCRDVVLDGRFLNTSPSVSYYRELKGAANG